MRIGAGKIYLMILVVGLTSCASQKIYAVNEYINSYKYIKDDQHHLKNLSEFYAAKGGNCKDFANAKYQLLKTSGYKDMKFVFVPLDYPEGHLMLQVGDYVLDNQTNKIKLASQVPGVRLTYKETVKIWGWKGDL